jgi:hypothetical protein
VSSSNSPTICGYWEGGSGSILLIEKGANAEAVHVEGEALEQLVKGDGNVDGDNLALRLKLIRERIELTLNLKIRSYGSFAYMEGDATDAQGSVRPVKFSLLAADVQGTWKDETTSLSFSKGRLGWLTDNIRHSEVDVSGRVFGRNGRTEKAGSIGILRRHVSGFLDATDFSHFNQFENAHRGHYGVPRSRRSLVPMYAEQCPKEGWWGSISVYISFDVSEDGSSMDGTVTPGSWGMPEWDSHARIEIGERKHLKQYLHLERVTSDTRSGSWL